MMNSDVIGVLLFAAMAAFPASIAFILFRYPRGFKRFSCECALFEFQRNWIRNWPDQDMRAMGWFFALLSLIPLVIGIASLLRS
jgi:hypothetical protein